MSLVQDYLVQRGISGDTAKLYGLEFDDRVSSKIVKERLGRRLPPGVNEILWFPITQPDGSVISYIARAFPRIADLPKFLCPLGSDGTPFLAPQLYKLAHGRPVILTESPIKALACNQAGIDTIGLNGVWGASLKNAGELYVIRADLQNVLDWRGRKVYLGFDADFLIKPEVKQALMRTFFILSVVGAEVYQLTSWQPEEGVGIDDYLVCKAGGNGQASKALKDLLQGARAFIDTIQPTPLDLGLVCTELRKVLIPPVLAEQLVRPLAKALNVRPNALRELLEQAAPEVESKLTCTTQYEPWSESVDADALLNEIIVRINKEALIEADQALVCALWVMFSWVHSQMEFSPIQYITGPDKECGKTMLLTVQGKMVKAPQGTDNISPAALYRLSEMYHPTILADEAQDQLKDPDFCLVIKSGHVPGKPAIRCHPTTMMPEAFDVFCPKLLAGIGRANGQIMSRSIVIEMERQNGRVDCSVKASDTIFVEIRRKLARWARDVGDLSVFSLPEGIAVRRGRDNWNMLYRVACGVSEDACQRLIKAIDSFVNEEEDFATYLLASLRTLYREKGEMTPEGFLASDDIIEALNQDKEAPWFAKDDKGLSREKLAHRLRRYKIKPDQVWDDTLKKRFRGYWYIDSRPHHNGLKKVFEQYLPEEKQEETTGK
jgi:hypothetical protein